MLGRNNCSLVAVNWRQGWDGIVNLHKARNTLTHSSTLTVPCQLVANRLVFHVKQEIVQQIEANHCIHLTIHIDTQMECDLPICVILANLHFHTTQLPTNCSSRMGFGFSCLLPTFLGPSLIP